MSPRSLVKRCSCCANGRLDCVWRGGGQEPRGTRGLRSREKGTFDDPVLARRSKLRLSSTWKAMKVDRVPLPVHTGYEAMVYPGWVPTHANKLWCGGYVASSEALLGAAL